MRAFENRSTESNGGAPRNRAPERARSASGHVVGSRFVWTKHSLRSVRAHDGPTKSKKPPRWIRRRLLAKSDASWSRRLVDLTFEIAIPGRCVTGLRAAATRSVHETQRAHPRRMRRARVGWFGMTAGHFFLRSLLTYELGFRFAPTSVCSQKCDFVGIFRVFRSPNATEAAGCPWRPRAHTMCERDR
jgi:hypothetical protein